MRILLLASFFPPDAQGGAEISAWNFAQWLRQHGHMVAVLTTARSPVDVVEGAIEHGLHIWRMVMPRAYPIHRHSGRTPLSKLVWHLQDHVDPRNSSILARVLDVFQPDRISVHLLTGIGWNALAEIGGRDIPVMFALPDLAIACLRSGMFRRGQDCQQQCLDCRVSSWWKQHQLAKVRRLGLYSPSIANLARLERFASLAGRPKRVLANPNRYPAPTVRHEPAAQIRFIYAGRLHPTKGVEILLEAAERLADHGRTFTVSIVGDGPAGPALRARYADKPWVQFHGHVAQQDVADLMAMSDVLCIPSIWSENAPGVAIQALSQSLPILASDRGGIPEIVAEGEGGHLVAAGDADAWTKAMIAIIDSPEKLPQMRINALKRSQNYDPERLGQQLLDFMDEIAISGAALPRPTIPT